MGRPSAEPGGGKQGVPQQFPGLRQRVISSQTVVQVIYSGGSWAEAGGSLPQPAEPPLSPASGAAGPGGSRTVGEPTPIPQTPCLLSPHALQHAAAAPSPFPEPDGVGAGGTVPGRRKGSV